MVRHHQSLILFLLFTLPLFLLVGCSTTNIGSWKNETYTGGPLSKTLVVAITQKNSVRRIFEDEFTKELGFHGVESIASYTLLPLDLLKDMEKLEAEIRKLDPDTVLITRLVGKRYERPISTPFSPGHHAHRGWQGYYTHSLAYTNPKVIDKKHQIAILESNLYETKKKKLIWSMQSETKIADKKMEILILGFIKVATKSLTKEGLLPK